MGLHGVGTMKSGTGACAAADGIKVLVALVAEGEVVHGALGGGHDPEGAEERCTGRFRRCPPLPPPDSLG